MATKQLYAGGTPLIPTGNYEKDNAAERIQHLEASVEEVKSKTYTSADVGADPAGSANSALTEAKGYTDDKISSIGIKGEAESLYRTGMVNITKQNLGIPNVENKSSDTIRNEITKANVVSALGYTPETNGAYENATAYTDVKIADLINGAPSTLDTLKEIADAMEENQTVVESLEAAVGSKASDVDVQAHKNNATVHITASERTGWDTAVTHAASAHAPSNAQKNSDITKAEIEAKLTGTITTHSHGAQIQVVADLLSTVAGSALDATMGKVLNDKILTIQQSFQGGCDAIMAAVTAKGSTPASNGVSDIVAAINTLTDTRDATMTAASQLLTGYTAYAKDAKYTGTMANRGAVTSALNAGASYTIPAGYHSGSGKITANTLASQTSANAVAANLTSGKTAWVNGAKITGTGADNTSNYNTGYTAGYNAAGPTINKITINYYYKGIKYPVGTVAVTYTASAVYTRQSNGTWVKSGSWTSEGNNVGAAPELYGMEAGITSIVLG